MACDGIQPPDLVQHTDGDYPVFVHYGLFNPIRVFSSSCLTWRCSSLRTDSWKRRTDLRKSRLLTSTFRQVWACSSQFNKTAVAIANTMAAPPRNSAMMSVIWWACSSPFREFHFQSIDLKNQIESGLDGSNPNPHWASPPLYPELQEFPECWGWG